MRVLVSASCSVLFRSESRSLLAVIPQFCSSYSRVQASFHFCCNRKMHRIVFCGRIPITTIASKLSGIQRCSKSSIAGRAAQAQNKDRHLTTPLSLKPNAGCLEVPFAPGKEPQNFSLLWLRDHCHCPSCYNANTFQRKFNVKNLFPEVKPKATEVDGETLTIEWEDGHKSEYPLQWLSENSFSSYKQRLSDSYNKRKAWDASEFSSLPIARIPVENLLTDKDNAYRKQAYESLWTYGAVFIENVEPNVPSTRAAVETIVPLMKTMWGEDPHVFEANDARSDTAYSMEYIGAHNDNTYFTEAAGMLALSCYHHEGTGGDNSLIDGLTIAKRLKEVDPAGFEFFTKNPIPSEFREEREGHKHHFLSNDYILKLDPLTQDVVQIRYNIYDRAPMSNMPAEKANEFYQHYRILGEIIDEMEKDSWFKLKPGSIVLFDNFRVLHARKAFTGRRVMVSCYAPRGDFLSGARSLGIIP